VRGFPLQTFSFQSMFVYILESLKDGKHYIGCSGDVDKRLDRHNKGGVKSTRNRIPLKLIYKEEVFSYRDARKRETELKKMKGGFQLKELLN